MTAAESIERALSTQTGHPTAEVDSREAVTDGCSRGWLDQPGQQLHELQRQQDQMSESLAPGCPEIEHHLSGGVGLY